MKEKSLSIEQFGLAIGAESHTTVREWVKPKGGRAPSPHYLVNIAHKFGITIDWILKGAPSQKHPGVVWTKPELEVELGARVALELEDRFPLDDLNANEPHTWVVVGSSALRAAVDALAIDAEAELRSTRLANEYYADLARKNAAYSALIDAARHSKVPAVRAAVAAVIDQDTHWGEGPTTAHALPESSRRLGIFRASSVAQGLAETK